MSQVTWKVYGSCGDSFEVTGGATPPYDRGDGITCGWDGPVKIQGIEAAR